MLSKFPSSWDFCNIVKVKIGNKCKSLVQRLPYTLMFMCAYICVYIYIYVTHENKHTCA